MSGKRRWVKSLRFDSAWDLYRGRDRLATAWKGWRFGHHQWYAALAGEQRRRFTRLKDAKAWCMEHTESDR